MTNHLPNGIIQFNFSMTSKCLFQKLINLIVRKTQISAQKDSNSLNLYYYQIVDIAANNQVHSCELKFFLIKAL